MAYLPSSYLLLFLSIREKEESFQVILMLLEFDNKTISDGHPLLKIRTIFVNLGGIQCYTFLIQGKTCHYLYPNLESWYHLAFVTPTIHPVSPSGHSWIVLCVHLASRMSKLYCNVSWNNACRTIGMSSSSYVMTNICVVRKCRLSYQSPTINFPGNTVWYEDNSKKISSQLFNGEVQFL